MVLFLPVDDTCMRNDYIWLVRMKIHKSRTLTNSTIERLEQIAQLKI